MNRNIVIAIVFVLITAAAGTIIFLLRKGPRYSWHIDYKKNSRQPYSTNIFFQLLKEKKEGLTVLPPYAYWKLDTSVRGSSYIFIGSDYPEDSLACDRLIEYLHKGNSVLIASDKTPEMLLSLLAPVSDSVWKYKWNSADVAYVSFTEHVPYAETLRFIYQQKKDTAKYYWGGYPWKKFRDEIQNTGFRPLAKINDSIVTAFYMNVGSGRIVLHSNPILFTNYYMINSRGYKHASNILSKLNEGEIFWADPWASEQNVSQNHENPLQFMFSHPYLKWAWYCFIITVTLYVIFRSQREQRAIPLVPVVEHTSIAHAQAVGTLYFKQGGRKQIAAEMHTLFLADLRSRYNISADLPESELATIVSEKSGVNREEVRQILRSFTLAKKTDTTSDEELVQLHKAIEIFYKTRR